MGVQQRVDDRLDGGQTDILESRLLHAVEVRCAAAGASVAVAVHTLAADAPHLTGPSAYLAGTLRAHTTADRRYCDTSGTRVA